MKRTVIRVAETIVSIAIILVIAETFCEELAVLAGWGLSVRLALVVAGFAFDLFFTLEFLTRFYWARVEKRAARYFFQERGWIDFLASVPLLLLNSGPGFLAMFNLGFLALSAGGIFNLLKVVKVIRIARVLRFLRIVKLFRTVRYADTKMGQRHTTRLATLVVTGLVVFIFGLTLARQVLPLPDLKQTIVTAWEREAARIDGARNDPARFWETIAEAAGAQSDLVMIRESNGTVVFSTLDDQELKARFNPDEDLEQLTVRSFIFVFDKTALNRDQALQNISWLSLVVLFVLLIVFLYSPHFSLTVTDPLIIMKKGFEDPRYNLEVKIPERFKEDEVYGLARTYNESYLPEKDRALAQGQKSGLALSLDAVDINRED